MSNPHRQRPQSQPDSPPSLEKHARLMGQIASQLETNASQMVTLTEQVTRVSEQVGKLVTAQEVTQTKIDNHADRMDGMEARILGMETRERGQQNRTMSNIFALDNSRMTWLLMAIGIVAAILSGHLK